MPLRRFVIVRHGNTFVAGEPPRRIGARTDLSLTETGMEQARALGVHFAARAWHFDRVLVSPLLRTRQTAQAILDCLPGSPQPEYRELLREIDHGPDENLPEEDVRRRIGDEAIAAWDDHAEPPPGWTVDAPARRAGWRDLLDSDGGPTLLVTSNGAARFALTATGLTVPNGLKLPTGGYGVIERASDGGLQVSEWGGRP